MADSWEGLLDIIGLNPKIRKNAHLKVLIEEPSGLLDNVLFQNLFKHITNIYGSERCAIVWWHNEIFSGHYPLTKIIGSDSYDILQELWGLNAGNYILFLPEGFELKKIGTEYNDDEEGFIGRTLDIYTHLILKTPDAYEILYLNLS